MGTGSKNNFSYQNPEKIYVLCKPCRAHLFEVLSSNSPAEAKPQLLRYPRWELGGWEAGDCSVLAAPMNTVQKAHTCAVWPQQGMCGHEGPALIPLCSCDFQEKGSQGDWFHWMTPHGGPSMFGLYLDEALRSWFLSFQLLGATLPYLLLWMPHSQSHLKNRRKSLRKGQNAQGQMLEMKSVAKHLRDIFIYL